MFEHIEIDTVNSLISFNGKDKIIFQGNEHIPIIQSRGVTALCKILSSRRYAYLADEVGMGKTYQALGLVSMLISEKPTAKILIIAPSQNVQENWAKEIIRFRNNNLLHVNAIEKVYQALSKLFTISATEKVYHLET